MRVETQEISNTEFDEIVREEGYTYLCGVDEAGRGPLAGPVYAAAVILNPQEIPEGLNDSKKLTEKKREKLFLEIQEKALSYAVASASVEEIESMNILQATFLAMKRAIDSLNCAPDMVMIDGNMVPPRLSVEAQAVVKGDARSATIAAASILAKVSRDRYMMQMDEAYPAYQFAKHKGYGTKVHYEALRENGLSPIHRRSFLKKLLMNAEE